MKVGLWSASILTGLIGIVNTLSAITPSFPARLAWLKPLYPFAVREGSHVFTAVTGFFFLILAASLLRRKRLAWQVTVGLLSLSIVSHLLKGLDYEEAILAGVLLIQLLLLRPLFTAQSDRPSMLQGVKVLLSALAFTLAYGTIGFFLLDRQYSKQFDLGAAVVQTLAMFFTEDNAGLQATTRYGRFFSDSIYVIGIITLGYALWMLLRPVLLRTEESAEHRAQAQRIVTEYGCSSLARFALLPDKFYYFSPSGQSVIAYVPKGRGAIALGDPIGPPQDRSEAIFGFQQFCDRNDWYPTFYQTVPEDLEIYQSLGFQTLKIGEEGVVDLKTFTLQGKPGKNLRTSMNKLTKAGYRVDFYPPLIADSLLHELRDISNEWLEEMQGAEKQFSLGWFDDDYLRDCEIAVVRAKSGDAIAFANIVPEYQRNDATIDLMRQRTEIEHGTMDFLFVSLFQHFQDRGYEGFNIGLSALSGVGNEAPARRLERGIHFLYEHLNQFYNFQGLHAYKDKFHPRWESRYLVYPGLTALPDVVVALVRADSGDRLLDYFKPSLITQISLPWERLTQIASALLGLSLFGVSIWAITQELQKYSFVKIINALQAIPNQFLLWAVGLTILNYAMLTGYDTLALRYIKQPLSWLKSAQAALISYAISNSVGFALLSGSAIRYRMYSAWGLSAAQIGRIIAFCNFSFWLGLMAVGGIIFLVEPIEVPKFLRLPFETVQPIGVIFSLMTAAYLCWSLIGRRPIRIKSWVLPHIPFRLSLAQIAVTSIDWLLAAGVLYLLLPRSVPLSFLGFFGIYLLAQVAGIISNVPGGLGVFETVMLLLLSPPVPSVDLFGALLAYRFIYYFFPLITAVLLLGLHEMTRNRGKEASSTAP